MQDRLIPSSWSLMTHLLRLYKDINQLIQEIEKKDISAIRDVLRSIIGRLKILNTLGNRIPWFFLTFIPIDILISSNEKFANLKRLKKYLIRLRNSLEKIIVGKTGVRLLHRKGTYLHLRNPITTLCVPSGFDSMLPGYTYIPGRRPILLTASHATPPSMDINTGLLARRIAVKAHAHALISQIPRLFIDPNRMVGRILPFRRKLDDLINSGKVRLILDLHSMEGHVDSVVDIGVWFGLSSTRTYVKKLTDVFSKYDIPYTISTRFIGGDIIFYHANKPYINAIQLEISNRIRKRALRVLSNAISEYIVSVGDAYRRL